TAFIKPSVKYTTTLIRFCPGAGRMLSSCSLAIDSGGALGSVGRTGLDPAPVPNVPPTKLMAATALSIGVLKWLAILKSTVALEEKLINATWSIVSSKLLTKAGTAA